MRYLLVSLVIAGALLTGVPCFADTGAGVSIPLSITVTGGSSGGGGGFGYSAPTRSLTWQELFPSMNQTESSAPIDNRRVETNPPEPPKPTILETRQQSESMTIPPTPVKEEFKVDWFLIACLGIILVTGTIIVILLIRSRRQY